MHKHTRGQSVASPQFLERLPGLRKLMQYSFMFFFVKGLMWTAVLAYPLIKGFSIF